MDKVRIGFVGVGQMGQCAHLKNYVTAPGCEVVAIAELCENLGGNVARKYGVPRIYRSHEEMIASEKLDGIVAAQPFRRHGLLVPELLKAGVPVFTEKPLASSIEAGQKIIDAERTSGTWVMVGYHKRSDPATMYAMAEIDRLRQTGELGAMRYVRIVMPDGDWIANGYVDLLTSNDPLPELEFDPPASDMDTHSNDVYVWFVNYYIHQVNMMRHILGEPYTVKYVDPNQILVAVQSKSGITGAMELRPYETTVDWQESITVCFQRGYVRVNLPAPLASNRPGTVEIMRDPGNGETPQTIVPQLPWVHAMRQQAMNFVAAIRGEMKPLCGTSEALEDLIVSREYVRLLTGV